MAKRDFYEILGVSKSADEKELKSAYRKLAMQYHPDRNPGNAEAEAKFKELNEAYDTLKDPQKRAAFDKFGHAAFENGGGRGGFDPGFGASMSDIFDDIFGEFMGGGQRRGQGQGGRRSGAERGSDMRYNMDITLEEAFTGKQVEIEVPTQITCTTCSGTGAKPGTQPSTCRTCGGIGKVRSSQGFFVVERTCPSCMGRGETIADPCRACSGSGRTTQERTLSVNVPAGIEDGTRIRLAGEGEAGTRGGPAGDLYIFLSVTPHALFNRDGADLYCRVPIPMTTAVLGGTIEVPVIGGGSTKVKVAEGTQSGTRISVRHKGMPVLRSSQVGDLYITLNVETPRNLTRRQRELMEEFTSLGSSENNPESSGFFARIRDLFGG